MKNRLVRFTSVFALILCMMVTLAPAPYVADVNETESVVAIEIPEDAIYISNAEELIEFAENCRVNTWSVGKTFVLSNDLDLTGTEFSGVPTFGGTLVGQGHTIKGINLVGKGSVVGFFRYLQETAIVDGLTLEGNVMPDGSKSTVGGFAGENAGVIQNCVFSGIVSGYDEIGGIVGENKTTGVIVKCTVRGSVYGSHFVGGIAGENDGEIRNCTNEAEINTKSVQNSVELEDITIDNMINTESANTATDIGGIAGNNSGIIRQCTNNGVVGYKNMGYNVGGIAGSQHGYLVDCVNNANIQGRKEVGGIVGHMEPYIVLEFEEDAFQILSKQVEMLGEQINVLSNMIEDSNNKISKEMNAIQKDLEDIQDTLDSISKELDSEKISEVDWDKISEDFSDVSDLISDVSKQISDIQEVISKMSKDAGNQVEVISEQLEVIIDSLAEFDENMEFSVKDVSDLDTEEDTLGKLSNCVNYGKISGELNVGGIAGVMADETDLDAYDDIDTVGETSLHGTYKMRVVVRDCKNFGIIAGSKQYVGGIAGQMIIGAVLESLNMGNLDALNADYVGGIVGDSMAVIRNCSSKSIIAGDTYVGGIAGDGKEVTDCYAFVSILAFHEKAGAILGNATELPEGGEEEVIRGNYYYVAGKNIGGIDGIAYTGATEKKELEDFLQLPELAEELRKVTLRFKVEGQEDQVFSINVGENFAESQIPVVSVEDVKEYNWKIVPAVTYETLGMGESATIDYISPESLSNILFDQTYEATFELKSTVIQVEDKSENNLAILLAEGIFAKNTTIKMEAETDMESFSVNWKVVLSNEGVTRLHYLIPTDLNAGYMKLYVKNADGKWAERTFTVDESYIVFDFTDADSNFALVEDYSDLSQMLTIVGICVALLIVIIFIVRHIHKAKLKKDSMIEK